MEGFAISKLEVGKSLTLRLVDQEIMGIINPLPSKDRENLLRSNFRFSDELIESAQQFAQRDDLVLCQRVQGKLLIWMGILYQIMETSLPNGFFSLFSCILCG